jgi:tetratricopeptide (TPR) repeat protein
MTTTMTQVPQLGKLSIITTTGSVLIVAVLLLYQPLSAKQNETVIGPSNIELADGANELLAGNAEEGIRLSLLGLHLGASKEDRKAGFSNVCAGYIMLQQYESALEYCNRAIELDASHWRAISNRALVYVKLERYEAAELDLQRGLKIAPNARTLRIVSEMLLDATNPVVPGVVIDDRRDTSDFDDEWSAIIQSEDQDP